MTPRNRNLLISSLLLMVLVFVVSYVVSILRLPSFLIFVVIFGGSFAMRYLFPTTGPRAPPFQPPQEPREPWE